MKIYYEPGGNTPPWLDRIIVWAIDHQVALSIIIWLLIAIGVVYLWRF